MYQHNIARFNYTTYNVFQTPIISPEFNDYQPFQPPLVVPEPEPPVFDILLFGRTLIVPEVPPVGDSRDPSVNMTGCMTNLDNVTQPEVQQADGPDTLSVIQEQYAQWKMVLVHLRVEMTSDVALGKPINLGLHMVKTGGVDIELSQFPSVSEVYDGLLGMAMVLFAQEDDPELPVLRVYLTEFCNLSNPSQIVAAMTRRHGSCERANRQHTATTARTAVAQPWPLNLLESPKQSHKQGREILPDSLLITASVLFGWVDSLYLIAVLHISLRVSAVERRLQQEEYTSITFLVQGGCCLMEQRMYRAQMEVSLFSKAIVNVYEELNTQYHPSTWQREILRDNPVMHVGTPLSVHDDALSVDFDRSRVSKATREKCKAWLSTSWQFQMNFPQTREVYEHVSKVPWFEPDQWSGSTTVWSTATPSNMTEPKIHSELVPEDFLPLFNATFSSDAKTSSSVSLLFVLLLPASQLSRMESSEASKFRKKSYQGFKLERADWKVHDVLKRLMASDGWYMSVTDAIQQGLKNVEKYCKKASELDIYPICLIYHREPSQPSYIGGHVCKTREA
ncbi:uncharacterized protein F5891DRAFT_987211 [Suillus fuscotomentosus]|uniref:Uncharacterized protein n=1 Tax=Suillus fuscotomentosus TaxID=1912939 RepID=A0AAD4DQK2_9AGAM|nr:uncharacterized protein F5891DRAFT_987211 [Suillus fuscotomentosus]KAG1889782.1 hypothetical protein F5891DRAFT_987211 [Suillus fuscotomentosus]